MIFRIFHLPALLLAFAATVTTSGASASEVFPHRIRDDLGLSYTPACDLCHAGGKTGVGTVTTPFGTSMRERGLVLGNQASVTAALAQMTDEAVDSDGDGTIDVDELRAGTDPNIQDEPPSDEEQEVDPMYGCRGAIAPRAPSRDQGLFFGALVAAALGASWRRRARGTR